MLQETYDQSLFIKAGEVTPHAGEDYMYSSWIEPACFPTYLVYAVFMCVFTEWDFHGAKPWTLEGRVSACP